MLPAEKEKKATGTNSNVSVHGQPTIYPVNMASFSRGINEAKEFSIKTDLTSKYLKKFANIRLDNKSLNSQSESDTDDEEKEIIAGNDLFVIDNTPLTDKSYCKPLVLSKSKEVRNDKSVQFPSELCPGIDLEDTYLKVNPEQQPKDATKRMTEITLRLAECQDLLKKSVLKLGFEQQYTVPTYLDSVRHMKKMRKAEREKSKGKEWFNLPAPEMTEELKNDLKVLHMRKALDPKHFYKKNDRSVPPKYFQVGTIVEGAADFYHSRVPKRDRKRTLVEELIADAELKRYMKRKYSEVMAAKPQKRNAHRHMKRLKNKKK